MIHRYAIWHLIVLTTLTAVLFATLPWSRPVARAAILISFWTAIHVLIARRLNCYQAVFPGVVSALLTGVLISELTGDATLGSHWLELDFHPLSIAQLIATMTVGWCAQVQYVQVRRRHERAFRHCDLSQTSEKAAER